MFDRPRYYFGIYHWRRRLRRLLAAAVLVGVAVVLRRRARRPSLRFASAVLAATALGRGYETARTLCSPPPWALERGKYDALASRLPFENAARVIDVGCGTGRSLVAIAPHVPSETEVVAVDVFDDRVILGNGPRLARRNASRAGLAVRPVAGDAANVPIADDAADVVTACRVLHDLPADAVDDAVRELGRICRPGGTVGVLALPIVPDGIDAPPGRYWRERLRDAGFEIERDVRHPRAGAGDYLVFVASPDADG